MEAKHMPGPFIEPDPIIERLQGRIAHLLRCGRVKDPEIMQSAVEKLTELADAAQCLLYGEAEPSGSLKKLDMDRLRAAIKSATGQ